MRPIENRASKVRTKRFSKQQYPKKTTSQADGDSSDDENPFFNEDDNLSLEDVNVVSEQQSYAKETKRHS